MSMACGNARSMEFMQTDLMETLRWLRAIGDTIFAIGALALGWFVIGLKTGWSLEATTDLSDENYPEIRPEKEKITT